MDLKVTINGKPNPCFTKHQMKSIAASLMLHIPDSMRLVYYGQIPPLDVTLTWQPTNSIGDPVGKVKVFKEGAWNE